MALTQSQSNVKWRKAHTKRYDLLVKIDSDIYRHMEKQPNKRQYLVKLIEEDMKKSTKN